MGEEACSQRREHWGPCAIAWLSHQKKKKKTHKKQSEIRDLIKLKNQRLIKICIHAKNVADGVVFSLDCKRRRVDYLRVPLVRDPVIFEQKRSEG